MDIWALSDLHLSFAAPKPMEVFGEHWRDHRVRIEAAWRASVQPADTVCLPGDLSWAMRLADVHQELEWLGSLPGRKILVKGNHDYWWGSLAKVRSALPAGALALQNDAAFLEGVAFGGARGWVDARLSFRDLFPGLAAGDDGSLPLEGIRGPEEDERIYRRELDRLEASLRSLDPRAKLRVALLHFPPTSPALEETPVTRLLERYGVDVVAFGHLHGQSAGGFRNPYGVRNGVRYLLVSADFADFAPVLAARGPFA